MEPPAQGMAQANSNTLKRPLHCEDSSSKKKKVQASIFLFKNGFYDIRSENFELMNLVGE
jgi:hypothetical protein